MTARPNLQPHAFDPLLQPELFRGVLTRRVFAFLIDLVVLAIPVILAYLFIVVFGVVTLGLGWAAVLAGVAGHGDLVAGLLRRHRSADRIRLPSACG